MGSGRRGESQASATPYIFGKKIRTEEISDCINY
jgi:hypothetical protein